VQLNHDADDERRSDQLAERLAAGAESCSDGQ